MRLPSLNALRAFEAAARHESFARAADELCVTEGAVSRHVKLLEEDLGVQLFRRLPRSLKLTEAGRKFLPVLTEAFESIASAARQTRGSKRELKVICPPTFSIRWLLPRLQQFRSSNPDIQLRLTTAPYDLEIFFGGDFDLGFDCGWQRPDGTKVAIEVLRKGNPMTFTVELGRLEEGEKLLNAAATPDVVEPEAQVLGMKLTRLTGDLRTRFKLPDNVDGAVVLEVAPSSPAADKRIEVGDVIAMANDEKITGPKDVQKQIDRVKAEGQKSILVVVNKAARRGDPHFLSLKVE